MQSAVMGLIVLLAAAAPDVVSPQNPEADVETLWKSEAARTDCVNALAANLDGPEPAACTQGTVAKLARGTGVRPLQSSATCGALKPVKVLSGKHTGKTGCLAVAALKREADRKKR